jgi:hypothetical protein
MTHEQKHHYITEHIYRIIRATLLICAAVVWLLQDGMTSTDYLILAILILAHVLESIHGLVCIGIQKLLHWRVDFIKWN